MIDYEYNGQTVQIIPLNEMEIGVYKGTCRNATYAYWNGVHFIHLRTKFFDTFLEKIEHPENDKIFDVFLPFERVDDDADDNVQQLMNAINGAIEKRYND
jgi:hypothetical protein